MKLKYYLRGLGIGIIVTTIILTISFSKREVKISDEEIIARALQLGMVMQEDAGEPQTDTEMEPQTEAEAEAQPETEEQTGTELQQETEEQTGTELQQETEEQTGTELQQENQVSEENYRLVIHTGDVCRVICENLKENGVVSDAEALRKYLFEAGYASNIRAGEYDIPYGASYEEIAQILKAGPLN